MKSYDNKIGLFGFILFIFLNNISIARSYRLDQKPVVFKNTIVFFLSPSCPICVGMQKDIFEIIKTNELKKRLSVVFIFLPTVSKEMKNEYVNNFAVKPNLIITDKKYHYAKLLVATILPSVFLIDSLGNIKYQGAIDNRYFAVGNKRKSADSSFLKNAINNYINGDSIVVKNTQPIGCKFL